MLFLVFVCAPCPPRIAIKSERLFSKLVNCLGRNPRGHPSGQTVTQAQDRTREPGAVRMEKFIYFLYRVQISWVPSYFSISNTSLVINLNDHFDKMWMRFFKKKKNVTNTVH